MRALLVDYILKIGLQLTGKAVTNKGYGHGMTMLAIPPFS
jgi:hypothetical protein